MSRSLKNQTPSSVWIAERAAYLRHTQDDSGESEGMIEAKLARMQSSSTVLNLHWRTYASLGS